MADIVAHLYSSHIPKHARGKLADLGCGKVPLFETYRDYVTDNICVDLRNTREANEYLDCVCDLTARLPFADHEFDTIILSDVLEHIPQPEKLWQEMSRLLTPKGKVLLSVPFCYWLHEGPHDFYRYTEFALRRFAQTTGFRVLFLEPIGGAAEIMTDILAKHLQSIPLVGPAFAVFVQYVTLAFIHTATGRRLAAKTNRSFPLGYFMVAEKDGETLPGGADIGPKEKS